MLRRMSRRQWKDWQAFFEKEPFGEVQQDLRVGYLLSVLTAAHGGEVRKPERWFPSLWRPPRPLTEEDVRIQILQWRAWVVARGGKVVETVVGPPAKGKE